MYTFFCFVVFVLCTFVICETLLSLVIEISPKPFFNHIIWIFPQNKSKKKSFSHTQQHKAAFII